MYLDPFNYGRDNSGRPGRPQYDDFESPSYGQMPYGQPPYGQTPMGQMPMGSPPGYTPTMPAWQEGSRGIRSCLFSNTYIWLRNGSNFWFFIVAVDRDSISGFRWSRRSGWRFRTISRDNIRSYECFR